MSNSNENKRKDLYKFSTPPWKETYRKRCIEKLRTNRSKFLDKFRGVNEYRCKISSMVEDVMTEEWNLLRRDHADLPGCSELLFPSNDQEILYLNSIMEEIQNALKSEEERMLELYCEDYEQSLCSAVDRLNAEEVICPVCQKNNFFMNKATILCKCGVRINTEQDGLTLSDVKRSIDQAREEHDSSCSNTAEYSLVNTVGIDNLLMSCSGCDFMFIVV